MCVETGGAWSPPRGTGEYTSSGSSSGSTHRPREPCTITPSSRLYSPASRASHSSIEPALVEASTSRSSSIHRPREPGLPASITIYRPRRRGWGWQSGHHKQHREPHPSTLEVFHTMCMTQLRETKDMLERSCVQNIEKDEMIEQLQKKMKNDSLSCWCSKNYKTGFTKIVVHRVSLMVLVLLQTFSKL